MSTLQRRRGPGRPSGGQSGEARDAILAGARELLALRGQAGLTLRELADRVGVRPALVHYYFGNKEGLLDAVVRGVAVTVRGRIAAAVTSGGDPEHRLRSLIRGVVDAFAAEPYAARLFVERVLGGEPDEIEEFFEEFVLPNFTALTALLEAGASQALFREVEPRYFVPSLVGSVAFFFLASPIVRRMFEVEAITPEITVPFAEHTATLILDGLLVRTGAEAT